MVNSTLSQPWRWYKPACQAVFSNILDSRKDSNEIKCFLFAFSLWVGLFVMPEFVLMQRALVFFVCLVCLFLIIVLAIQVSFFCELPVHLFGLFKKWVVCGFLIDLQEFLIFYGWYLFVSYVCCRLCVHIWFWILTLLVVPFIC